MIAHIANGAGWTSTVILINTDSVAAPYTLKFYADDGSALSLPFQGVLQSTVSGTIQPGQEQILETDGTGDYPVPWGWALLQTQNALGGTCIFAQTGVSEAAVPFAALSNGGGKTIYMPYDNTGGTFITGFALADPGSSAATLTVGFVTDSGLSIQPLQQPAPMAANGHYADVVNAGVYAPTQNTSGVMQIISNLDLFGIAIRSRSSGAFTSLPVLPVNQ